MGLPKGFITEKNDIPEFIKFAEDYLDNCDPDKFDDGFNKELYFILVSRN